MKQYFTKRLLLFCMFLCVGVGVAMHGVRNRWIIIRNPHAATPTLEQNNVPRASTSEQHKIQLSYGTTQRAPETRDVVWQPDNKSGNLATIVSTYFTFLTEEAVLQKKIDVQTAALTMNGHHLIISLTQSPFETKMSTRAKWNIVDGLLQSIHLTYREISEVTVLVHHQPLQDPHLEFSLALPIPSVAQTKKNVPTQNQRASDTECTLMIDPVGDARTTGRIIGNAFERTITAAYAHALKKSIESQTPSIKVIITSSIGELVEPLQRAAFANRLNVTFFIKLQAYEHASEIPEIAVSYMDYPTNFSSAGHQNRSHSASHGQAAALLPYQYAHRAAGPRNAQISSHITQTLIDTKPRTATIAPCQAIALKPLSGIAVNACLIELGLKGSVKNLTDAPLDSKLVDALAHAIIQSICLA